jgi:prepilin-type N-terminal cleavage/methylation domain-containing protein
MEVSAIMQPKQNQRGFTLIELVVVIAILAILASFALPRFVQLAEQAHRSSVKATAGALAAAVALVKVQWMSNGLTGAAVDVAGFGEDNVDVSADGWPTSTSSNSTNTSMNTALCQQVWQGLLQPNAPSVATSAPADYLVTAAAPQCTFTYTLDGQNGTATAKSIVYDASTGAVTTNNVD